MHQMPMLTEKYGIERVEKESYIIHNTNTVLIVIIIISGPFTSNYDMAFNFHTIYQLYISEKLTNFLSPTNRM